MQIERRVYPKGTKITDGNYIQRSNVYATDIDEAIEYTNSEQEFHGESVVVFRRVDLARVIAI